MITQNSSAPLIAVVGATGIQGGSVIKTLTASSKPYRVRGFTRDATKPVSQDLIAKGVEMVTVSLVVDNVKEVFKAFEGANMAFLVTNFLEHMDAERETAEAKMMIDAAKVGGVERIVWSGLPHCTKLSAGKITHVGHYDSKAAASGYGRQSGIPFVDVQAGFYASNFFNPWIAPVKRADGTYAIPLPLSPTVPLPVIDMARDYGLYVLRALEAPVFPDGSEVHTGLDITMEEVAIQLSQVTGKRIIIEQITLDQYGKKMADSGAPVHVVVDMLDAWKWFEEFGYYGGEATSSVEGLAKHPLSFREFAKAEDWSKVFM
ncbi:NAD(P)-binding protein [Mycena venus]|uniref:NAD(P)-binding protein n=1 Tax=Mycena venus TaxID=2733690 RepID=A0A8H7CSE0_9AGAR|nr:NAD(P)-binding protein [Mycena venus]